MATGRGDISHEKYKTDGYPTSPNIERDRSYIFWQLNCTLLIMPMLKELLRTYVGYSNKAMYKNS